MYIHTYICVYGVATISRLLKMIGLFCKRALQKRRYSAKGTYNFKEPTNRSHSKSEYGYGESGGCAPLSTYVRVAVCTCVCIHIHVYTYTYVLQCVIYTCVAVCVAVCVGVCWCVLQCVLK